MSEFSDALGVEGGGPPNLKAILLTVFSLNSTWGKKDEDYRDYIKYLFFKKKFFFSFLGNANWFVYFLIAKSAVLENTDRRTVK